MHASRHLHAPHAAPADGLLGAALAQLRPAVSPALQGRLALVASRAPSSSAGARAPRRALLASSWLLTRFLPAWLRTRPATLMHRTPGTPPVATRSALAERLHQMTVDDTDTLIAVVEDVFTAMGRPAARRPAMIALAQTPAAAMLVVAHRGPRPHGGVLAVAPVTWEHLEVALGTALAWAVPTPSSGLSVDLRGAVARAATNRVLSASAVELFEHI